MDFARIDATKTFGRTHEPTYCTLCTRICAVNEEMYTIESNYFKMFICRLCHSILETVI